MSEEETSVVFLVTHTAAGGVQELWADLAAQFSHEGVAVKLYALYPPRVGDSHHPEGIEWSYVAKRAPTRIPDLFSLLVHTRKMLRTEAPTHVFTAMPMANFVAPLMGLFSGIGTKFIVSQHTLANLQRWIFRRLDGVIGALPSVTSIVCVSNAVAKSLGKKSGRYVSKIEIIHNALPPKIESLLGDLRNTSLVRRRTVVAAGRLSAEKNYPVIIRAAARLPDVTFNFIGGGPEEKSLRILAEQLGVTDQVHFLGPLSRPDTLRVVANADIFVQPSFVEGHSLALIEASKLSLPLIVSSIPSQIEGITSEDGTRCGIPVGPEDDAGLARAIESTLLDPVMYDKWRYLSEKLANEITFRKMLDGYLRLLTADRQVKMPAEPFNLTP